MGNPNQWSVEELCGTLNQTAATDKDNIIPIDGPTGGGKSTLGLKLCMAGCAWFDMQKDILYSRKEIIEWITNARPGSWGLADEAVNALFKRDFQRGEQKFILKLLDMCRDRNLTLFLCIPNFWALDKHILEGRVRLRLHVASTGMCFMWKPSGNPFTTDMWYRKYNEVVCRNWDSYPNALKTKGFIGYIQFGDLGVRQKEVYLEIKARKKAEIKAAEEAEEKKTDYNKIRSVELGKWTMIDFLDKNKMLTRGWYKILAVEFGVTERAIYKRLKDFRDREKIPDVEQNNYAQEDILYNIKGDTNDLNQPEEGFNNIH